MNDCKNCKLRGFTTAKKALETIDAVSLSIIDGIKVSLGNMRDELESAVDEIGADMQLTDNNLPESEAGPMSPETVIAEMKKTLDATPQPKTASPMNPWQFRFARMLPILLYFAASKGYTVTIGNARVDKGCTTCGGGKRKPTSLHYDGLAVDLNLFKNGKFLTATADHRELGEFWESLGGSWGGRFNDGNHYSLAHNGRK